jgi:hypothetical protein
MLYCSSNKSCSEKPQQGNRDFSEMLHWFRNRASQKYIDQLTDGRTSAEMLHLSSNRDYSEKSHWSLISSEIPYRFSNRRGFQNRIPGIFHQSSN